MTRVDVMALSKPPSPADATVHDGPSDAEVVAMLNYAAPASSPGKRAKNFRLAGTGLNPLLTYASAVGFVLFWVLGALALSMFGPIFAIIVTAGICGAAAALSARQLRRDARIGARLCPKCGCDLRDVGDRCPGCGGPVPEEILRWRRLRPRLEPGMEGYVPPKVLLPRPSQEAATRSLEDPATQG